MLKVSYQENAWSPISKEYSIEEILSLIQSGKFEKQVVRLRCLLKDGNERAYATHKKTLPAVTFCGTFNGERKKTNLQTYNSLLVLDIDKLSQQEIFRAKDCLKNDTYVFSFWESPSGAGIKGLVVLSYTTAFNKQNIDVSHKEAFQKVAVYFKLKYGIELDNSGSDTTRLCFMSFDPAMEIKSNISPFEVKIETTQVIEKRKSRSKQIYINNRDALYNPKNKNNPENRYTIRAIVRFLKTQNKSITFTYEEWYKVAMAIANTFTYDIGEKYFLQLSSFDVSKYNEMNCKKFLYNCYESKNGEITFNSIVYMANKQGFLTKKQREKSFEGVR